MAGADKSDAAQNAGATKADDSKITIPAGQEFALCCSGGGIRSATFNLGVIQALQDAGIFSAVRTVTAVSGGAYMAAAHALVMADPHRPADGSPPGPALAGSDVPARLLSPPAYALRTPEERHLRDHTRYLLESWQIAVRAVVTLIHGVLVNAILVGAVIYISGKLAGWLLGTGRVGVLTGLHDGSPRADLKGYWLIPVALAVATAVLAWRQARPSGKRRTRRRRSERLRRLMRLIFRDHPARWSNRALVGTLATAFVFVAAPLAVKGLYTVSLGNGNWATITRFLGFSSSQACKAAAAVAITTPQASDQVCGAAVVSVAAAARQGGTGSQVPVLVSTFGGVAAAIVALARATIGRLRTYQADLKSSPFASVAARIGGFLQRRLVPWIGSALIVAGILLLALRWIGSSAGLPLAQGGWNSDLARCLYALAAFVLVKMLIDINSTSMHGFYRDRLATAYGVVRQPGGSDVSDAAWARLGMLRDRNGPDLVICAAANCTKSGDLPPGRGSVSFTFTPDDIGLSREEVASSDAPPQTRAATTDYEAKAGLTLFDAVAVSAAAISPVMGKMTRPSMRILLAAAGVRLGVWLDSPKAVEEYNERVRERAALRDRRLPQLGRCRRNIIRRLPGRLRRIAAVMARRWLQPDLQHLWAEAVGSLHLDGRWIYVTDGGHYENLGLVEALRRRPDHLIVVDASGDAAGEFSTLGQAVALARSELRVQIEIPSVDDLKPDGKGLCPKPYTTGHFTYPDEAPGRVGVHHLVYIKLAVPADAPLDVIAYRQKHTRFPTDSTLQQLYDDQEFESYRELGYYCARAAAQGIVWLPSLVQEIA